MVTQNEKIFAHVAHSFSVVVDAPHMFPSVDISALIRGGKGAKMLNKLKRI